MKVRLKIFEGPLDLLLYLIRKNRIDIQDIPISEILHQYLKYLEWMKAFDLDVAGEFLVLASTLMYIKSQMLLPKPELEEELVEEDPRRELVMRLLEYQKYKELAQFLKHREKERQMQFRRSGGDLPDDEEEYFEASLFDLISALNNALKEVPKDTFYEVIKDEFTVEEKKSHLLQMLLEKDTIYFTEIFSECRSKLEVVATILALLELIRLHEIRAFQKTLFGEVIITRFIDGEHFYGRRQKLAYRSGE